MSGLSLAAGPRIEPEMRHVSKNQAVVGGLIGSLRAIELQLVTFVLVFSACGLIPLWDMAFSFFISVYLLGLSRWAFPSYVKPRASLEVFDESRVFEVYVIMDTAIGLFLPLSYVLGGFARGDQFAVRSATPHLFLLSFQLLSQNIISSLAIFSKPVRALVPVLYTVRRVFVIIEWNLDMFYSVKLPQKPRFQDMAWMWFGRGLAVANLIYFSINLFCFLIPRYLPCAFEGYFQDKLEHHAKAAQDKVVQQQNKSE